MNYAPVLDGANNFTTITEDNLANSGNLVSTLVSGLITDPDPGALQGIAVTKLDNGNGNWQYSTNSGLTWSDFLAVSNTSATLLGTSPSDRMRFVPDGRNGTVGAVTFRAWDQTDEHASGTTGMDVSTSGGLSPYSTATAAANITVTSVNDAPVLSGANDFTPIALSQTSSSGDPVSTLIAGKLTDVDLGAMQGIAVTAVNSGNGAWQYSINAGVTWTAIGAVADNSALLVRSTDRIRFVPNGTTATTASVTFRAWDQTSGAAGSKANASVNGGTTAFSTAPATANITVAVNHAPVLSGANNFTTITADQTTNGGNLVSTLISGKVADADRGALQGIAVTALNNGNGAWQYSINAGVTWTAIGAVANNSALLLRSNDLLRLVPNGTNGTTGSVTFRAWDQTAGTAGAKMGTTPSGGSSSFSSATATANIAVTSVNHAPMLSGANDFTNISEDQTTNGGNLVVTLIAGKLTDTNILALQGIAVTGLNGGNGTWQYSTNLGGTWTAIGAVADNSALLLRSADAIRFAPDAKNGTAGSVTFRAWDQTSGAAGTQVNASVNGGTTAFSTATATSNITVTSVNDAPALSGANSLTTIAANQTTNSGDPVSTLLAGKVNDVDIGAAQGIAVTALNSGNGTWQYSTNAGSTWTAIGTVRTRSALLLGSADGIRFVPNGTTATTASITFCAWDQTGGAHGTKVNTNVNGGTTAFSTATATSTITVTAPAIGAAAAVAPNPVTVGQTPAAAVLLGANAGWKTLVGDWNGDGNTDEGFYAAETSTFYLIGAADSGNVEYTFGYGEPGAGWIPLVGDWNGDGRTGVGLYDPRTSTFYLTKTLQTGSAELTFGYGQPGGWIPIVGDWNGDGQAGVGLYDPRTSTFYLTDTLSSGYAQYMFGYGQPDAGWQPLVGDWNGDGAASVGLYDPSASLFYLSNALVTGCAESTFGYGVPGSGWKPLVGDWNGDNQAGVGLYAPDNSTFYLANSFDTGFAAYTIQCVGGQPVVNGSPTALDPSAVDHIHLTDRVAPELTQIASLEAALAGAFDGTRAVDLAFTALRS